MTEIHADQPHGVLYVVSTPIGNLGDMTYRGLETLRAVRTVLAEDTRRTRKLLAHFGIQKTLLSYHDFNKERVTPKIVERLKGGEDLALVTDAGTPGVSDPGFYLVREAIRQGIRISVVPGANAILPALVMSGFPTDAFVFEGFLPRKKGELERKLAKLAEERRTSIFFVPPHQLVKVLDAISRTLPDREVAVVRELTKIHEEVRRGSAAELVDHFGRGAVRGEIVLLIKGSAGK